jgi:hypothetical protein
VPRQPLGNEPAAQVVALDLDGRQQPPVAVFAVAVDGGRLALRHRGHPVAGDSAEQLPTLGRVDAVDADALLGVALVQAGNRVTVGHVHDTPLDGIGSVQLWHGGHEHDGGDEGSHGPHRKAGQGRAATAAPSLRPRPLMAYGGPPLHPPRATLLGHRERPCHIVWTAAKVFLRDLDVHCT